MAGVDQGDLAPTARDPAADLGEWSLRRREPDPLERTLDDPLEPLERDREVRAALCPGECVHLVEDQRLDAPQHLASLRGEEQEERLGGGDEDVRRRAQHPGAIALRGVAGAHADRELRAQPRQRAAKVPLDVVVERLERRDVEEAQALAGRVVQPVDPLQEGGQRLAGPGRRLDEHVRARRDRRPGLLLRRGRAGKRSLEPGSRRR